MSPTIGETLSVIVGSTAIGLVMSMFTEKTPEIPLVLPAGSVAVAVIVFRPSGSGDAHS